jgi:8-amino-7-oxononanoate synthase
MHSIFNTLISDSSAAAVLTNPAIRSYLINYARGLIFSIAPAFPSLAAVKAGYSILASKEGEEVSSHENGW